MRRPSFQMYPDAWLGNAKLKRCTHAEKGMWIDLMCLMHDGEPYGILRWPLSELAHAIGCITAELTPLTVKGVLKGADSGERCEPFIYIPRSGRKNGPPIILIHEQLGPIWYSSRMVIDEYKRIIRELSINSARKKSPINGLDYTNGAAPITVNGEAPITVNGAAPITVEDVHLSEDEDEEEEERSYARKNL